MSILFYEIQWRDHNKNCLSLQLIHFKCWRSQYFISPTQQVWGGGGGGIYLDLAVCQSVSPGWVIVGTTPLKPLHMVCQIRFDGNMHLHTKFQDILWMKNDYEIVISHNLIMKIINDNFFASLHAVLFFFFNLKDEFTYHID